MEKKQYIMPLVTSYRVKVTSMICGSTPEGATIPGGSDGDEPTPTTKDGNTGIFTESKSADFDFEDE